MLKTLKDMDLYINTIITKIIKDITGYLVKRKDYLGYMADSFFFNYDINPDVHGVWFKDDKLNRISRKFVYSLDSLLKKIVEFILVFIHFCLYVSIVRYIIQNILFYLSGLIFERWFFIGTSLCFILGYLIYLSDKNDFLESRNS